MSAELPNLYTEEEVANYLKVSSETVARERRRGLLSHTRVATEIRFTAEHIVEYLKRNEVCAEAEQPNKEQAIPER